jgi:hypothetical protein
VFADAPVNVPDTPAGFGAAGVGVAAGVDFVVVGVVVPVVALFVLFFFLEVVVAFFVAAGAGVAAGVDVVPPEPLANELVPPDNEVPVPSASPLVLPNCGGVIERTAPNPPTVPPAIKKKRFVIIFLS